MCLFLRSVFFSRVLFLLKIALFWNLSVKTVGVEILWPVERIQNVASRVNFGELERQTYYLHLKKTNLKKKSSHVRFGEKVAKKVLISKQKTFCNKLRDNRKFVAKISLLQKVEYSFSKLFV